MTTPPGSPKSMISARQTRRAVLENARDNGFHPGTIIDVGFAVGTEGLYGVFEDVHHLLIEPVAELEPAMARFCQTHPNSSYLVAAVSETAGEQSMVVRRVVGASSFHGTLKTGDAEMRQVPTFSLDQLVRERDLPKPYLLKMDIEGHELHALRGAREVCLEDTEMVILEVNTWMETRKRGSASMMDLFTFMDAHGFVFYDLIEPNYRPHDKALAVFDGVWVKTDSILRSKRSHRGAEDRSISKERKAGRANPYFSGPSSD